MWWHHCYCCCHVCGLAFGTGVLVFLFSFPKAQSGAAALSDSSSSAGGDSDSDGRWDMMDTATEVLNQVLANRQKRTICGKHSDQAFSNVDFGYADVNCYYCHSTLCWNGFSNIVILMCLLG